MWVVDVVQGLLKLGMKKGGECNTKFGAILKNMKLYAQRGSKSNLAQVNNHVGEWNWLK
jgi:hypothetical protein